MSEAQNIKSSGPVTVADTFKFNWWLLGLRGVIAIVFGMIALAWPGATLLSLIWLFGAFALVNGILSLVMAVRRPGGCPRVGSLILGGLLGILVGLLTFVMPGATALGLILLIAAWAMVTGVTEIVAAIKLRRVMTNEWFLFLAGIASVLFGVLLAIEPKAGAVILVWTLGAWALVFGILLIVLAFRMRNAKGVVSIPSTAL